MILKREKTVFKLIYLITILSQLILEQQDPPLRKENCLLFVPVSKRCPFFFLTLYFYYYCDDYDF